MSARHRWMVYMPFEVTPEDARRATTGEGLGGHAARPDTELARGEVPAVDDPRPWFGLHNLVRELVAVGCYVCEQPYTDEVAAQPCPGDPEGKELHLPPSGVGSGAVAPQVGFSGVGRNDPCPCASGRKFKHCHGR